MAAIFDEIKNLNIKFTREECKLWYDLDVNWMNDRECDKFFNAVMMIFMVEFCGFIGEKEKKCLLKFEKWKIGQRFG